MAALEQLISYAKDHALAKSVIYIKEQCSNAAQGRIRTRTADLLNERTAADRKSKPNL